MGQQQQQQQMQQDQQQLQQNQLIAQVAAPTPTVVEPKIVSVPAHGVTPVGPPMNLTPTIMVPTGHPMQVPPGTAGPPHGSMVTVTGAQPIPISIPTQPVQMQAATTVLNQQQNPQTVTLHHGGIIGPYKDHTALRAEILKREPVEPARSPKQLFITDWLSKHKKKKLADAKEAWKTIGKQENKKWTKRRRLDGKMNHPIQIRMTLAMSLTTIVIPILKVILICRCNPYKFVHTIITYEICM